MMDRAFQEQYLQKTDQEKELDRKIYVKRIIEFVICSNLKTPQLL